MSDNARICAARSRQCFELLTWDAGNWGLRSFTTEATENQDRKLRRARQVRLSVARPLQRRADHSPPFSDSYTLRQLCPPFRDALSGIPLARQRWTGSPAGHHGTRRYLDETSLTRLIHSNLNCRAFSGSGSGLKFQRYAAVHRQ